MAEAPEVLRCTGFAAEHLFGLLTRYGLRLVSVGARQPIPGSYWGEPEAGLVGNDLLARADTPIHSVLHEACHYVCMDGTRRAALDTNAGGGYDEENGVCYLQVLLSEQLIGMGRARMLRDMDSWGYSFRLGSSQAWFEDDAEDARAWLTRHELIDGDQRVTWRLRR
jgi:hypothetical protein